MKLIDIIHVNVKELISPFTEWIKKIQTKRLEGIQKMLHIQQCGMS
jgi:hypothetical protein